MSSTSELRRDEADRRPIFVLGLMQRVGTNYLRDLLLLHRDTVGRSPIEEDHLVQRAGHLVDYVDHVWWSWRSHDVPEAERDLLLHSLGDGIVAFLCAGAGDKGARVVTKTPSVENLDAFFDLFPSSDLVVIIRDGRSVVESGMRSFGWTFDSAVERWATAARSILAFSERYGNDPRFSLVRYEDLVTDLDTEMRKLLTRVRLDTSAYDYAAAKSLPIRGSSSTKESDGAVHWKPVDRDDEFAPLDRWQGWTEYQHQRFDAVAGESQRRLGYELEPTPPATLTTKAHFAAGDVVAKVKRLRRRYLQWRVARSWRSFGRRRRSDQEEGA